MFKRKKKPAPETPKKDAVETARKELFKQQDASRGPFEKRGGAA